MAEVGDTDGGAAKVGNNGRIAPTQENRKLQHTDEQKPGSEQKSGNQPNQPVQQKQENPGGQPKSPQSEQEKHDQEKKKQA